MWWQGFWTGVALIWGSALLVVALLFWLANRPPQRERRGYWQVVPSHPDRRPFVIVKLKGQP